jgi:hypothetical protein
MKGGVNHMSEPLEKWFCAIEWQGGESSAWGDSASEAEENCFINVPDNAECSYYRNELCIVR